MERAATGLTATIRVRSPSRLHFGLLAFGDRLPRGFGGVGLMVQDPGLCLEVTLAETNSVSGDVPPNIHDRCLKIVAAVQEHIPRLSAAVHIQRIPNEHTGLGTGTQLSLCLARALAELAGVPASVQDLARWTGRGLRSAIGIHGFERGGLLVDGGKSADTSVAPLLSRIPFPNWPILLIRPSVAVGMHGQVERQAIADHPPIRRDRQDRLARLLLDLLAAAADSQYDDFADALYEYNRLVGECFAFAQGGPYAHPKLEQIVQTLRGRQVPAVGQSSWGPTLFAVCRDDATAAAVYDYLIEQQIVEEPELIRTQACNRGALVERIETSDG